MEVADGFVDQTGAYPSRGLPVGIGKIATSRNTDPHLVSTGTIIHEKVGNGSAAAADGDGRRVRRVSSESLRSSAAGNPFSYRFHVCRVGAGEERRERDLRVRRLVGVVNVAGGLPTIGAAVRSGGSS